MDAGSLAIGSRVAIVGLLRKQELNGLHGIIVSAHGERWAVKMDQGGAPILVRAACLELLAPNLLSSADGHFGKQTALGLMEVFRRANARICSNIVPINMERIAATCSSLRDAMRESRGEYKKCTHFEKEEWVLIDDLKNTSFNQRVGQIIERCKPTIEFLQAPSVYGLSRYIVEVDGLRSKEQAQTGSQGYMLRSRGSRKVSLPSSSLSRIKGSVLHVRIHSDGSDGECFDATTRELEACDLHWGVSRIVLSEVYMPPGLDQSVDTKCPLMESAGQGLFLRPAPFRGPPSCMEKQCWAISKLRTDHSKSPPEQWWDDAGPHTVGWQDGSDFTMEDMVSVWSFFRDNYELDWEAEGHRFRAINFMPQVKTAAGYWECHAACASCKLSKRLLSPLEPLVCTPVDHVITPVEHEEPAALISPEDASDFVHQQWVSQVESRPASEPCEVQNVLCHVLTFSRHPQRLDTVLCKSALGQRVQEVQPDWARGAKVLVPSLTQQMWADAMAFMGKAIELRPYHVLVLEEDIDEVMMILESSIGKRVCRLKSGAPVLPVPDPTVTDLFSISELGETHITSELDGAIESSGSSSVSILDIEGEQFAESSYRVYLSIPISRTFLNAPVTPMVSPRSSCTVSAPAALMNETSDDTDTENPREVAEHINPRRWGKAPC